MAATMHLCVCLCVCMCACVHVCACVRACGCVAGGGRRGGSRVGDVRVLFWKTCRQPPQRPLLHFIRVFFTDMAVRCGRSSRRRPSARGWGVPTGLCAESDMPDIVRLVLGNVRLVLGNVRLKSTMVAGFQAWAGNVQASKLAAHSPVHHTTPHYATPTPVSPTAPPLTVGRPQKALAVECRTPCPTALGSLYFKNAFSRACEL